MKIGNFVKSIVTLVLVLFLGVSQAVILPQTDAKSEKTKAKQVTQASGQRKAFYLRFSAGKKANVLTAVSAMGARVDHHLDRYNTLVISLPEQAVKSLSALPNVKLLEPVPEYKLQAQVVPWNIDQFQARDVWDTDRDGVVDPGAPNGSGVKFCIIDTGFWAAHDDFQGITHSGMSQIPGEAYTEDGNGHGTHVAGIANAVNNSIGVVGVMPGGAELVIVKIFDNAGNWSPGNSNLGVAVEYCRDQGANVISMSLGGSSSATENAIFQDIYDNNNILSIAAAGNDGNTVSSYPASYESVISVASVRQSDNVSDFSQYPATAHDPLNQPGNTEWDVVELSGGGELVLSTWPGPPAGPNGTVPIVQVTNDGTDYTALRIAETATGDVTQNLVDGNLCDVGDINANWAGQVVLCSRGNISFADKMNNVASNGGLAVVLYNNVAGSLSATCGGNCTSGAGIPGVSLTQAEGQFLQANGLGLSTRVLVDDGSGCVGCSGGYNTISGTSMATPGVAAGVAWAWDACGGPTGITNKQLRQLLRDSARDLSGTHDQSGEVYGAGWDTHTGFGLVQLKDALDLGNQRFGSTCPIGFVVQPQSVDVCTIPTAPNAIYNITLNDNFTGNTNMTFSGLPTGASAAFSPATIVFPATTSTFTVSNLDNLSLGTRTMTLTATDAGDPLNVESNDIILKTFSALPEGLGLVAPADAASGVGMLPTFSWAAAEGGRSYTLEIATDPLFSNIVQSIPGLETTTASATSPLNASTTYYWRVTVENPCGNVVSTVFSFTTLNQVCTIYTSTDVPKTIAATPSPGAVISTLNVPDSGTILDVNVVNLSGEHTWISDLVFKLKSPDATEITLMDQICGNEDNWNLGFDDEAASGTLPCPPTGGLSYQPATALSAFDGKEMNGNWIFTVDDSVNQDGGALNTWGLEICSSPPPPATYTVGGTVSGLAGSGLVLQNNGGDNLPVNADGSFTFLTPLNDGSSYSVTVQAQPGSPAQNCSISNASGTLAGANITDVTVSCITNTYTVGGTVSGLLGLGLVLQNNLGDNLPINTDGSFTFVTAINDGSNYAVSVASQPGGPNQNCSVSQASGTINGTNITNVAVSCATLTYTIGGSVIGLAGTGLVLQNNGGDNLAINADGNFTFATPLTDGSAYVVTVISEPAIPDQSCSLNNASGNLAGSNVTNVGVTCVTTCRVTTGSGMVDAGSVNMEACEEVLTDPTVFVTQTGVLNLAAGLGITLGEGFTVETGGIMNAKVCGQSLCEVSPQPMVNACHTCVTDICAVDASCCTNQYSQACVDKVSSICGLTCN